MSVKENYATPEEVLIWVRKRVKELEEELRILKTILAQYEAGVGSPIVNPAEKVEEYKIGKRLVAKIYIGDNYVRMTPVFDIILPSDVEEYLKTFVDELTSRQAKSGAEERATLKLVNGPDGTLREIRIENLNTTLEKLKAKATLKYAAELLYRLYKSGGKGEEDDI